MWKRKVPWSISIFFEKEQLTLRARSSNGLTMPSKEASKLRKRVTKTWIWFLIWIWFFSTKRKNRWETPFLANFLRLCARKVAFGFQMGHIWSLEEGWGRCWKKFGLEQIKRHWWKATRAVQGSLLHHKRRRKAPFDEKMLARCIDRWSFSSKEFLPTS